MYLAEDPLLKRQVAIKTIDLSLEDPAEREFMLERLMKDARSAAMLSHPNVVCVYDVLLEGSAAYLVMEYVPGESLATLLSSGVKPDLMFTMKVLREVAAALDYTHGRGVIHRDVKPANVMVSSAGAAKIMDFGIARIADSRTSTPTGMVVGTLQYMAPEHIKGEALDGRADQFSLAAMAYQMLSGSTLFGPHNPATLAYKIINEDPPLASTRNPMVTAAADGVLAKALNKLPEQRFTSCAGFAAALESALADQSSPVAAVSAQSTMPAALALPAASEGLNKQRTMRRMIVVGSFVLIAIAAVSAWLVRTTRPSPDQGRPAASSLASPTVANSTLATIDSMAKQDEHRTTATAAHSGRTSQQSKKPESDASTQSLRHPGDGQYTSPESDSGTRPSNAAKALLIRGQELMRDRQFPQAVRSLSQAIQMDSDYAVAHMERGIAYMNEDQPQLAIADFSRVVQLVPGNANAYHERAICHVRLKDDKRAVADFTSAIELNPNLPGPFNGRGLAHMRLGGYRKAVADFDAAIRLSPTFATAYQNRARARAALGDNAGAKADQETVRRLRMQNGDKFSSQ